MKILKRVSLIFTLSLIVVMSGFLFAGCSAKTYKFYGIIDEADGKSVIEYKNLTDEKKEELKDYLNSSIILDDNTFIWCTSTGDGDYISEARNSGTYTSDNNKLKLYFSAENREKGVSLSADMDDNQIVIYDGIYFIVFKK